MIWSERRNFCFIHIPKTGGSAISFGYAKVMNLAMFSSGVLSSLRNCSKYTGRGLVSINTPTRAKWRRWWDRSASNGVFPSPLSVIRWPA